MKIERAFVLAVICVAFPTVSATASTFAEFLASFEELSLPLSIPQSSATGDTGRSAKSLSLEDVEQFIIIPGRQLQSMRIGLRPLEKWNSRMVYDPASSIEEPYRRDFRAVGRWQIEGFHLVLVAFFWDHYLLTFTSAGKLVDGIADFPAPESPILPVDPVIRQGRLESIWFVLDRRGRVHLNERWTVITMGHEGETRAEHAISGTPTEIELHGLEISPDGTFRPCEPIRRYQLSSIYGNGEPSPRLCVYQSNDGDQPAAPVFLSYAADQYAVPIEGEVPTMPGPGQTVDVVGPSGENPFRLTFRCDGRVATITRADGGRCDLPIAFGKGENGEDTVLTVTTAADTRGESLYWPEQQAQYLFAPALLPIALSSIEGSGVPKEQRLFAARTWTFGDVDPNRNHAAESEPVVWGTLTDGSSLSCDGTKIILSPGSLSGGPDAGEGPLAQPASLVLGEGKVTLAAGTSVSVKDGKLQWLVSKSEIRVQLRQMALAIPAGSTIAVQGSQLLYCVFSRPISIRAGRLDVSIFWALFSEGMITEARLAEPVRLALAGATVTSATEVSFDSSGNLSLVRHPLILATCTDSRVQLRQGPGLQGETLGYLMSGDLVEILDKSSEQTMIGTVFDHWYEIRRLSDSLIGWTFGYYLKW